MEDINFIMDVAKEKKKKSLEHLDKAFINIRAGKANPAMLSSVKMEYYGTQTPLSQVANINTPDAQTLSVQPWDKTQIPEIEKAILVANLGFNPSNNGESVIINIPPLTEERRRELVKLSKAEAENAKVGVRNARKDANNELKKTVKKLIQAIPQDRILWHQDVKDLVDEVEEQMEKHDVRD